MEQHFHATNQLVRDALRKIAKSYGVPGREVVDAFRACNESITVDFWLLIDGAHPGKYNRVAFCHSCRKFSLWFEAE
ncbi:hypothetical protein [Azotobacter chroococcum]|uniref:hypothetical protein n=1 Tax=Azotobacter chroococcum TaxID=353 RepID=UPI0010ADDFCE|nr:hypothetical protein [Azotobacter chroococcum]TKD46230.1 hypothetical protein FCG41_02405 [Azotobacter chroococcum]